ncbi:unnamed protein product [Mytilus coruscus]|uniref:Kringle domain-containing protein n=1 Tax=Mytilus coruscus TaxID=42192 RepID=A0A6J8AKK4_MYTCO|nr:unnamed protein product [Mytilus coruscus]
MNNAIIIVVSILSGIVLKCAGTDCFENDNGVISYTGTTSVTHTGKTCQRWDTNYPHDRYYILGSEHHNYCRSPDAERGFWCYTMDVNTRWEYCDIPQCGLSTETGTVTNTQITSVTSVSLRESTTEGFMNMITNDTSPAIDTESTPYTIRELFSPMSENANTAISILMTETATQTTTGIEYINTNGEWSMWEDWKFCEVNCVREDTTDGKQRRWRKCTGSKCSGNYMEERPCSELGICKGMRPRKLSCKCPKRLINTKWHFLDGKNILNSEVKKRVLEDFNKNIKSEISVDKKTVSKEVRKKISSVNKRKSAQSIGWGCIVFLILPMVFLIAIDILNCYIHFRARCGRKKQNRIATISVIQDHGHNANTLQENVDNTEEFFCQRKW